MASRKYWEDQLNSAVAVAREANQWAIWHEPTHPVGANWRSRRDRHMAIARHAQLALKSA